MLNALRWQYALVGDCLVAHPVGVLDALAYRDVRDTLVKFAVDQPHAVIVVVDQVRFPVPAALSAFSAAAMRVSDWPGVPIVVVTGRAEQRAMFDDSKVSRFVSVFTEVADALAAVAQQPPGCRRALLDLDRDVLSARRARLFVRQTCQHWEVAEQSEDAEQIATELVENVLRHTLSESRLRLELRAGLLTIAVGDGSPREAVLHERCAGAERGSGLHIVADRAKAWGCAPQLLGGKVVWATLRTRDRVARFR